MNGQTRYFLSIFLCLVLAASAFPASALASVQEQVNRQPPAAIQPAPAANASVLLAQVNALRQAHGLPAYKVNSALMAAAQGHSEYMASSGMVTHSGPGGSTAKSRAIAAGYGGGSAVFVTENIAAGTNMNPAQAVSVWGDAIHMATMLSTSATEAGAGVATAGDMVYYTLDVGYVSGQEGSGAGGALAATAPPGGSAVKTSTPAAAAPLVMPIKTATPGPDGSVVHVVEPGQALWNIAATYKVNLAELLALNNLKSNSIIHPGDRLIIHQGSLAAQGTATETLTATLTVTLTATLAPTKTATPRPPTATRLAASPTAGQPAAGALAPGAKAPPSPEGRGVDPLLVVIIALMVLGFSLLGVGTLLKRSA